MSDEEALGLLMTMTIVGAEDTARTFANIIREQDRSIGPALPLEFSDEAGYAVIDETIRHSPSTHYIRRTTTRKMVEREVSIPEGARVVILFGAANRDPLMFSNPDHFDPNRTNSQRAMGFSRGAHSCLGIHVARLQLMSGLREITKRSLKREVRYEEGEWVHAMNISGYQHLPGRIEWA
jgi:hypothetical protein